jgi:putative FmdB family regulatory protein
MQSEFYSLAKRNLARYNLDELTVSGIEVFNFNMPIYTYRCENCGVQFERRQKFTEDPLTICPECEESSLRKVYLPVGIVFKGSGFYSTDNRSPSGENRSSVKKEKESGSESEEKTSSKKPETEKKSSESKEK